VYGDGNQTRTFCFIDDNVDATYNVFQQACADQHFPNDIINIGNDNETSIIELAKTIVSLTQSNSEIKHLPPLKEGDMTRRLPDISKMRLLLQRDLLSLQGGIEKILHDISFIM
jgi:nucleoside-diphosphate-sugar epimerase